MSARSSKSKSRFMLHAAPVFVQIRIIARTPNLSPLNHAVADAVMVIFLSYHNTFSLQKSLNIKPYRRYIMVIQIAYLQPLSVRR